MPIAIRGCRRDTRLDYKCDPNLSGNADEPLRRHGGDITVTFNMLTGILIVGIIHLIVATVHLALYAKKEFSRNKPDTCLRKDNKDCLTYDEYKLVFETACSSLDSDDPTYKAMKINFDGAILHETLKCKKNLTYVPKSNEIHSIL